MKIATISKVASLVVFSVMIQTAVAGHAVGIGVGPHFGDGGFGGGIFGTLFGGGSFHSRQRDAISSVNQSTANARPQIASRMQDPTVTAVQQALTKLGYYHRSIDGLYGRATRKAVARYQSDHHLPATGTLTSQMLRLLRVPPISRAEIGHNTKQFQIRKGNSEG
jgi:hypothetical protein